MSEKTSDRRLRAKNSIVPARVLCVSVLLCCETLSMSDNIPLQKQTKHPGGAPKKKYSEKAASSKRNDRKKARDYLIDLAGSEEDMHQLIKDLVNWPIESQEEQKAKELVGQLGFNIGTALECLPPYSRLRLPLLSVLSWNIPGSLFSEITSIHPSTIQRARSYEDPDIILACATVLVCSLCFERLLIFFFFFFLLFSRVLSNGAEFLHMNTNGLCSGFRAMHLCVLEPKMRSDCSGGLGKIHMLRTSRMSQNKLIGNLVPNRS
jgi:hypothetical protein